MNQRGRGGPPRAPRGSFRGGPRGGGGGHSRPRDDSGTGFDRDSGHNQVNGKHHSKGDLVELSIRGWRNSKAAESSDGGIGKLREFLERKASPPNGPPAKITKGRSEGDTYVISIRPELVDRMLHLNGFSFAGAPLIVERASNDLAHEIQASPFDHRPNGQTHTPNGFSTRYQAPSSATGNDTKAALTQVLGKRYDPVAKLLNLSALKQDPDLQQLGIFANPTTEAKFFPALMTICDEAWKTPKEKADNVQSVSLSNNNLVSVVDVSTLATTFPSLKNLDMSNNLISDFEGIKFWQWKFRALEFLVLTNNPIASALDFRKTILKWYPKLLNLNGVEVRTKKDIEKQQNPIPVLSPYFQDEADIGAKFVTDFFPLFDADRDTALRNFYDANSTFSVSVNTHAKRVALDESHSQSSNWNNHIKHSRNLLKITHLPARQSRLFHGKQIQPIWRQMPRTKHPSLSQEPKNWLIECHPLPGLPDLQGGTPSGVGGLIIMVHGHFEEMDPHTGKTIDRRSFDRTFVLGPGAGIGGIRVVSDILVLRGPGGSEAWGMSSTYQDPVNIPEPSIPHPEVTPESGIGQPGPGKTELQVQQEVLAISLSFKTSMKLKWAAQCLTENAWDLDRAFAVFQDLVHREKIPAEAFLVVK